MERLTRHINILLLICALTALFSGIGIFSGYAQQAGVKKEDEKRATAAMRQAKIYYNDGVRHYYLGHIGHSEEQFRISLSYDSLYISSHEWLIDIMRINGKEDSVKAVYTAKAREHPNEPVYSYLTTVFLDSSESEKALIDIIGRYPYFYWGYYGLGRLYLTSGKYQDAAEQLQKAVSMNPTLSEGQYALGITYERLELLDKAIKQFQKTLIINPNGKPEAYLQLGRLYLDAADTTQCLENYNSFLRYVQFGSDYEYAQAQVDSIQSAIEQSKIREKLEKEAKKKKGKGGGENL